MCIRVGHAQKVLFLKIHFPTDSVEILRATAKVHTVNASKVKKISFADYSDKSGNNIYRLRQV